MIPGRSQILSGRTQARPGVECLASTAQTYTPSTSTLVALCTYSSSEEGRRLTTFEQHASGGNGRSVMRGGVRVRAGLRSMQAVNLATGPRRRGLLDLAAAESR